jgi:nucleoside-diphosphate-sugar epimerase
MIVSEIANDKIQLVFAVKETAHQYAPDMNLSLDTSLLRSLGWLPKVGLKEAYVRMIKGMREC